MSPAIHDAIAKLKFVRGEEGLWLGRLRGAPCILQFRPGDPGLLTFYIRLLPIASRARLAKRPSTPEGSPVPLPPDSRGSPQVSATVAGDYLRISVVDDGATCAENIASILDASVPDFAHLLPPVSGFCLSCHAEKPTQLIQSGTKITALCEACLTHARRGGDNAFSPMSVIRRLFVIPFAILSGGAVWALLWLSFSFYGRLYQTTGFASSTLIELTSILLLVALGLIVAWATVTVARCLGETTQPPRLIGALVLTFVAALVAQFSYSLLILLLRGEPFDLEVVWLLTVSLTFTNVDVSPLNLLVAVAAMAGGFFYLLKPSPRPVSSTRRGRN